MLYLANPDTKRREYPEVSFGVVQGVVLGLMGVDVVPGTRIVTSLYRSRCNYDASLRDLPILGTSISIRHSGAQRSLASNPGRKEITWRAEFSGAYSSGSVTYAAEFGGEHNSETANGKPVWMKQVMDRQGHIVSYVDLPLGPGQLAEVSVCRH